MLCCIKVILLIVNEYEINIGANGLIGTAEQQLANTGKHQFVEIIRDGKSMIIDNFFNKGISREEFLERISGAVSDLDTIT